MATDLPQDEIQAFYEFLGRRIESAGANLSPEESVREFRAYQDDLARFRTTIATARDQAARGEAKPLDVDALMERVNQRLADDSSN